MFSKTLKVSCLVGVSLLAAGAGVPRSGHAATTGLVASYHFDENKGAVLHDSSGNGNDGAIAGATWAAGKSNSALSFNGRDSWVTIPDSSSLDLSKGMTIEAWVDPTRLTGSWRTVVVKEQPAQLAYALYAYGAGPGASSHINNGSDRYATTPSVLPTGRWSFLAGTYDGSNIRLYVNGQLSATLAASGSAVQSNAPLRIGGNSLWSEWFSGLIDEVKIYSTPLPSAQITADMNGASQTTDSQAPTVPGAVSNTAASSSSISVSWAASTDNVAVAGYTLYKNNASLGSQTGTSYTYTGLACNTSYTLAVDAYDAAGNRSSKTSLISSTKPCPSDTQPPSSPSNLQTSSISQTGLTLSWSAATDNVAVNAYEISVNGITTSSTSQTSLTLNNLSCGSSYTLGVTATDAAGNRSTQTTASASTTACGAPSAGSANLWIDQNGGSCIRKAPAGAYIDAQACGSLQAAANAAASGDLILIKDGSYPGEQLTGTKTVTFQGAGPGRPSFGQIITNASNITVRHLLIQNRNYPVQTICSYWDYTLYVCGPNQTYDDVVVDGMDKGKAQGDSSRLGAIQIDTGATNFVFKNGEIKQIRDNKGIQGGADGMLIENNLIHDVGLTQAGGNAGVHLECAAVTEGNNQTWRRNKFFDCSVINWVAQNWVGGPAFGPVTLENNVFAHPMLDDVNGSWQNGAPCLTIVGGNNGTNSVANWVVRFNTFECGISVGTPSTADDNHSGKWYGNLGTDPGCGAPEWTISYNVGQVCSTSPGNIVVANSLNTSNQPNQAPFYAGAPNSDFHLKPGTNPAVNINAPSYPTTDLDGNPRPFNGAADAGAYERQN